MTEKIPKLVEIPYEEWSELMNLFAPNWPEHILGYSIVRNFIEWRHKSNGQPIRNLNFYSLDGDWKKDGTFLVIDRYQLFIYSLVDDGSLPKDQASPLETALGLLDWSQGYKVSSFSSKHRRSVVRVVESKRLEREFDSETILYHLPKDQANALSSRQCRPDMIIRPLSSKDVPLAESLWPNRHSGSLFFLNRLRDWNPNLGVYQKLPNGEEGEMMGWCFTLQAGALGALQVREEFQGRGIGTLLTVAMAKLMRDLDRDTFAFVGFENHGSRRIFEKLNFVQIDTIHWLRTYPVGKQVSIWEGDSN